MGGRMRIIERCGRIGESVFGSLQGIFESIQYVFNLLAVRLCITGQVLFKTVYHVVADVEGRVGVLKMQQYPVLEAWDADDGMQWMPFGVVTQLVQSSVEGFMVIAV